MEHDVFSALASAIAAGGAERAQSRGGTRPNIVQSARALIQGGLDKPLTVTDLCEQLRVSPSTLRQSFLEHLGVSPQSYIKARRLNAVRALLREAPPDTRVSLVAGQFGFWHMGQFAADYRRQFGVLPSESLASAK